MNTEFLSDYLEDKFGQIAGLEVMRIVAALIDEYEASTRPSHAPA